MTRDDPEEDRFAGLPGAELVRRGLADLRSGALSEEALLVLIASPRLERLGVLVPRIVTGPGPHEHELYARLDERLGRGAHAHYNALIRRVVSFVHALESVG